MSIGKVTALLFIAIQATGCATILNGTTQTIPISSDPEGAGVVVNGVDRGVTPTSVRLKRNRDHTVVLELDGQSRTIQLISGTGGSTAASAGNILLGGIIGLGVDAASGAMFELSPDFVHVDF